MPRIGASLHEAGPCERPVLPIALYKADLPFIPLICLSASKIEQTGSAHRNPDAQTAHRKTENQTCIVTSPGRAKSTRAQHHSARHSTCTHPKRDFGPPGLLSLSRSRLEIVGNRPQVDTPSRRRWGDQSIARMRAPRLHDMRNPAIVVIGRHPDAARINDNDTITHNDTRDMGMPTQHELRITGPDQPTADSVRVIKPRVPRRDIFQKVFQVPSGRTAMTGEHPSIQQPRLTGKRPQPFPMVFRQARPRIGIGGTCPTCQQLAFVIACHRYGRKRHLNIRSARRVERSGNQIPQIHDQVGIFMGNITQHGFQSQAVSMDIGDHGDPHAASIFQSRRGSPRDRNRARPGETGLAVGTGEQVMKKGGTYAASLAVPCQASRQVSVIM